MADELVDVVNENDEVIGRELKSECHRRGLLHRVGAVFIFNDDGKLLLQKRAMNKSVGSGMYDASAAEHIASGETYEKGTLKELEEELGIKEVPIELFFEGLVTESNGNGNSIRHRSYFFKGYHNGPFDIQRSEVDSVCFYSESLIKRAVRRFPDKFVEGLKVGLMIT